jgi:hypothetical protein
MQHVWVVRLTVVVGCMLALVCRCLVQVSLYDCTHCTDVVGHGSPCYFIGCRNGCLLLQVHQANVLGSKVWAWHVNAMQDCSHGTKLVADCRSMSACTHLVLLLQDVVAAHCACHWKRL